MEQKEIKRIRNLQREFFLSGATLDVDYRISALKTLRECIKAHEDEICEALHADLGKSVTESYMCEIGLVYDELRYMISHVERLSKERWVPTPLAQFASRSFVKPSPRGTALIMSPWNYPILLTFDPLIDAIAAGNTAMVKPSVQSPATTEVITKIIELCFPEKYVAMVTGGRAENRYLLDEKFDVIFFTGSKNVGKYVMNKASEHLTPVILELGGKSPCVVDRSADIPLAARRIVFGKFLNCGQTCVAPDYILCDREVKDKLIASLSVEMRKQFGGNPLENEDYGKIINQKQYDRLVGLLDEEKIIIGGRHDDETLRIEPTVMSEVSWDDPVMQDEIFGPILPIICFDNVNEALNIINEHANPLALYVFAEEKWVQQAFTSACTFGGGCINDCIIHLATTHMPFGGVGESGMGAYHGKVGFDSFSHLKSIVDKKTWLDLPVRYQPYKESYYNLIRRLMK